MARRRKRSFLWRVVRLALLVAVAYIAWEALTWPSVAALAGKSPETTAFIERWKTGQHRHSAVTS